MLAFKKEFIMLGFAHVFNTCIGFLKPYLISSVIRFFQDRDQDTEKGLKLVAAMVIVQFLQELIGTHLGF